MTTPLIAITGGIGSGKSYVCQLLRDMGTEVYDCDSAAKRLMATDLTLQAQLCALVGESVYQDGTLQKKALATFLLASEKNKQAVNDIVHPAVARDFMASGCQWLESAILFESGFHLRVPFTHVVCVVAPLETRVSRVMKRDNISRQQALRWIAAQMPQEEMARRSHFVIHNDGTAPLLPQLRDTLHALGLA